MVVFSHGAIGTPPQKKGDMKPMRKQVFDDNSGAFATLLFVVGLACYGLYELFHTTWILIRSFF